MKGESQCLSGELIEYQDKCLGLVENFKEFTLQENYKSTRVQTNLLGYKQYHSRLINLLEPKQGHSGLV
jgi:hypothetical protein